MTRSRAHIEDAALLLAAEGELRPQLLTSVREHLQECAGCRARAADIGSKLGRLGAQYRDEIAPLVPARPGLERLARALPADGGEKFWVSLANGFPWRLSGHWHWVGIAALALVAAFSLHWQHQRTVDTSAQAGGFDVDDRPLPDSRITPGAVRTVDANAVCEDRLAPPSRAIPGRMQSEVLREYRMSNVRPQDYELDYLITPELGGADDIRNLWPEPYEHTQWNARVKDQLEDHLHEMVCHGQLDLTTAQQDIATDWISAYKKYFHTEAPLSTPQATFRN
jgi:hypothetical protein